YAARRAIPIEHIERDLCVEDRLADSLKREQLAGLRFEFLDAWTPCLGDGLEDNHRHSFESKATQSKRQQRGSRARSGGNFIGPGILREITREQPIELGEPGHGLFLLEFSSRQVNDLCLGMASGDEIGSSKLGRTGEENNLCAIKTAFLDRLDDRGFATRFCQGPRSGVFVEKPQIGVREAAFLEQRFQLGPK